MSKKEKLYIIIMKETADRLTFSFCQSFIHVFHQHVDFKKNNLISI